MTSVSMPLIAIGNSFISHSTFKFYGSRLSPSVKMHCSHLKTYCTSYYTWSRFNKEILVKIITASYIICVMKIWISILNWIRCLDFRIHHYFQVLRNKIDIGLYSDDNSTQCVLHMLQLCWIQGESKRTAPTSGFFGGGIKMIWCDSNGTNPQRRFHQLSN